MTIKAKLVYRPTASGKSRPQALDLYMPVDMNKVVRTLCDQYNVSLNSFICDAIQEKIERENGQSVGAIARSISDDNVKLYDFRSKPLSRNDLGPESDADAAERTLSNMPLPGIAKGNPGKFVSINKDGVER